MPYLNIDNVQIYYEVHGSGPPLLLINGITADTRQWKPLIDRLKEDFQMISFDMRCSGKSDKPTKAMSIEQHAHDAATLIKHLGYKKIHVLGFSMGGMVAQQMALLYPNIIDRLVFLSTAPSLSGPHPISSEAYQMMHAKEFSTELLHTIYQTIFGPRYRKSVSVKAYIQTKLADDNPQSPEAYWNQLQALKKHDFVNRMGQIIHPALVIAGNCDTLIPPENSSWLCDHLPHAKLKLFDDVGHMIPLECPETLAKTVKQFLRHL